MTASWGRFKNQIFDRGDSHGCWQNGSRTTGLEQLRRDEPARRHLATRNGEVGEQESPATLVEKAMVQEMIQDYNRNRISPKTGRKCRSEKEQF